MAKHLTVTLTDDQFNALKQYCDMVTEPSTDTDGKFTTKKSWVGPLQWLRWAVKQQLVPVLAQFPTAAVAAKHAQIKALHDEIAVASEVAIDVDDER